MIADKNNKAWKILTIFIVVLLLNLPIISALQISGVTAEPSATEAEVQWKTDEPADSFVNYGQSKDNLKTIGDASSVVDHLLILSDLLPKTTYYYSVKSGNLIDDNSGNLFTFTTPEPDTTPPKLEVEVPAAVKGNNADISGKTENNAIINIYVNGPLVHTTAATLVRDETDKDLNGVFLVSGIALENDKQNSIKIEAADKSGNKVSVQKNIFADTSRPVITLVTLPTIVSEKKVTLKGTLSEESSYEIMVGEKSVAKDKGTSIQEEVPLQEGSNEITITATDNSGWTSEARINILSDTKAPTIDFDLLKGKEYYEGNARTDISGTTEPGAKVYLYVFRPLSYEFTPTFGKAWDEVTANEHGAFTFYKVNLEESKISLSDLAPR
ncbi:MAG: fibronectin type III domain-containing protein, partial [Nanoarchaeota archaeon]